MMNPRVLELLSNPKNIQSEDLHLLKEEINSFPYIQNIRALHLYGVHLFDKENYQKELSTTAAYTTDKKILYQLINGKIQQRKIETVEKETQPIVDKSEANKTQNNKEPFWWVNEKRTFPKHDYKTVAENLATPKSEIKHVVVNGERNRILFEGEENFLDEKNTETIDLESTLESGVIVTQKSSFPIKRPVDAEKNPESENEDFETGNVAETAKSEVIINEDVIDSEKADGKITNEAEVSFLEIETVKPETESQSEELIENKNSTENVEEENTPEVLKSEVIINDDVIDSEKAVEKITDESKVSFLEIDTFKTETESQSENSAEALNTETIINEDKIDSKDVAEKINDDSELSFHGTDSFLPEIKIEAPVSDQINPVEAPKSNINKHEDEMRRLIEEVEKKMKAHKKEAEEKTIETEVETGGEISFAETQDFVVSNEKTEEKAEVSQETQENSSEEKNNDSVLEEIKEENSGWKPMTLESFAPDSFSKKIELESVKEEKTEEIKEISEENISEEKQATITENTSENSDKIEIQEVESDNFIEEKEEKEDEARVMNVSFFGTDISSLAIKKEEQNLPQEKVEEKTLNEEKQAPLDSNVPGFINTWQSWLKIDRTEEIEKAKTEVKNKAIESFIENNPKISQLKDEVTFVVKEKTDDISHLMTETLANLYVEQKLYTKAINAFQILVNKHPERKEYFENKIQEIKDNRGKN
ncbi:putative sodium/potassium/calcium exchanger [Chryseobacterium terrae]|uniref:Tetratricopeptide repeat-containing protein n=1 Tax=Chryseobacterium terrae TaxID=3163299 RepID=A0ABW8Y4C7_9FLAO